jgi:2-polyprenyl-6-methoxyphenol hydroxylase-like FAD-dependent oxidoreductase
MYLQELRIGIVGGSLCGLAMANMLARAGGAVTVIEHRLDGFEARGGGLGVDLELSAHIREQAEAPPHLALTRRRVWFAGNEHEEPLKTHVTSYGALWRWLRAGLVETNTPMLFGERASWDESLNAIHSPRLMLADSRTLDFDLLVFADGGDSRGRRCIVGEEQTRRYAGYVLWRGLVRAVALDPKHNLVDRLHLANAGAHHFVAYPIPTTDALRRLNERILNWGWYFPLAEGELLALVGENGDGQAPHAIGRRPLPNGWQEALESLSPELWPDWVQHIVAMTMAHGGIAPHPVHEYEPTRMVRGRIALAGDAAHLASPITGGGARMAMEDALALGAALVQAANLDEALATYERQRLEASRAMVRHGRALGESFRERRGARRLVDPSGSFFNEPESRATIGQSRRRR